MAERIEAAEVGELDAGEMKSVEAGERTVVLSKRAQPRSQYRPTP